MEGFGGSTVTSGKPCAESAVHCWVYLLLRMLCRKMLFIPRIRGKSPDCMICCDFPQTGMRITTVKYMSVYVQGVPG